MKYRQLTKEQLESLHKEFAQFLATQKIDAVQWQKMKSENSSLVEEELNLFSDMVWDQFLNKITYLENRSDYHLFLFKCENARIDLILIRVEKDCPSLMDKDYKQWLAKNLSDPRVDIFESSRTFQETLKEEKFKLMNQGAKVSDGETFEDLKSFLSK